MKIALIGYGKMGKTIENLATKKGHTIVYKATADWSEGNLNEAEVAIEFSTPTTAITNLKECFEKGIPVVCGTTGWLENYDEIAQICEEKNSAMLYASNFSLGVNIFFHVNRVLAKVMENFPEYKVQIEETHHTEKLDAPSGTAISIAEDIVPFRNKKHWTLDKETEDSIPIFAYRKSDVKGTHTVTYRSEIDNLSISHEAHSREGFAVGAILAAEWLKDKKGVYTMDDVLQLKQTI